MCSCKYLQNSLPVLILQTVTVLRNEMCLTKKFITPETHFSETIQRLLSTFNYFLLSPPLLGNTCVASLGSFKDLVEAIFLEPFNGPPNSFFLMAKVEAAKSSIGWGNRKKSQWARSGEQGGCPSNLNLFLAMKACGNMLHFTVSSGASYNKISQTIPFLHFS